MMSRANITETQAALDASQARLKRLGGRYSLLTVLVILVITFASEVAGAAISSGLLQYALATVFTALLLAPIIALFLRSANDEQRRADELMQSLALQLNDAIDAAEGEATRRQTQVQRQEFETRLANALEMAEGEPEVNDVIERALAGALPSSPVELLLADNSHAHLSRVVATSPTGEPPRCEVDSPDHCPAARRAQVQRFVDSEDLDACPKLRGRELGRCSAVCVPVSIMGRTMGAIHATGDPGAVFDEDRVNDLTTLAKLAGARIGLLRVMDETQLQAATDSLTGLMNRRTLENQVHRIRAEGTPFALAMVDLDQFKEINDTYGHDTGDRALRLFAQTMRSSVRDHDLVCRHGGEEFVVVFPRCSAADARTALESVRTKLGPTIIGSGMPAFTASFGVVDAQTADDLPVTVNRADEALFEAKRAGRDRIVVHDADGVAVTPGPEAGTHGNGTHETVRGRPSRSEQAPLGASR